MGPASIVVHAVVARLGTLGFASSMVGGRLARRYGRGDTSAIVLVVVAGGWSPAPNRFGCPRLAESYGVNMFLYPLSRMTGGIYFEHAHRLYGSLVGLTALLHMILLAW